MVVFGSDSAVRLAHERGATGAPEADREAAANPAVGIDSTTASAAATGITATAKRGRWASPINFGSIGTSRARLYPERDCPPRHIAPGDALGDALVWDAQSRA